MHGVVLLFDAGAEVVFKHETAVLSSKVGLGFVPTVPHLSLHVAESYDFARLKPAVSQIAKQIMPVGVRMAGIGVFPQKEQAILYATVVKTPQLTLIQGFVRQSLIGLCGGEHPKYVGDQWVSHVTFGAVDKGRLGEAVSYLAGSAWAWETTAVRLAIMEERDGVHVNHFEARIG